MTQNRILLVEDDPSQSMLVKMRLKLSGYDCVAAVDGEEALTRLEKEKPELILLDLTMPKLDGYEVCRRLKQDASTSRIPIIIMTAHTDKEIIAKCLACGADDVVVKPFETKDFLSKIKTLLV